VGLEARREASVDHQNWGMKTVRELLKITLIKDKKVERSGSKRGGKFRGLVNSSRVPESRCAATQGKDSR